MHLLRWKAVINDDRLRQSSNEGAMCLGKISLGTPRSLSRRLPRSNPPERASPLSSPRNSPLPIACSRGFRQELGHDMLLIGGAQGRSMPIAGKLDETRAGAAPSHLLRRGRG